MTAIFDIINPTLQFCVQDFVWVTDPAAPLQSLASASITACVYRLGKPKHIDALIAALPTFKAEEITFNQCSFHGYTIAIFRALAYSSIHKVNCWPAHLTFDEDYSHLEWQFQVRVAMFALLHARRRGVALRRLPLEMYRLVGQML